MADLSGRNVLAIVTNYGVEQDELVVPVERLRGSRAAVTVAAQSEGEIQTLVGDKDPGKTVRADTTYGAVDADAYDLLVIPGGTLNADSLRLDADAMGLVTAFAAASKPVAAICHGPWALVETGLVRGKRLTSYASLATDIRNAGAQEWTDEEVVVDAANGFRLITSRTPKDLDAFLGAVEDALTS
ncbi:protease I [Mumia flava]|uniref:Protease I n=1 Tax=Mumia flava TaxID=1348852 RepID=A0A0B2BLH7_9ACTN|nr:type 1 glutamine amidotransferase domain-containing protein [Mumia flava]PJJ56187.1 protease I [Mumia flava]